MRKVLYFEGGTCPTSENSVRAKFAEHPFHEIG
jgi:hypothetical protein